jgi:hypothetical protein
MTIASNRRRAVMPTARQRDVLAAYATTGGSVAAAAELVGIRPGTAKRHLADPRLRLGLTTEQSMYAGQAAGWLVVPSLEHSPRGADALRRCSEPCHSPS